MYSKVGCNCAHSNTHTISAARFGDVCAHAVAGAGGRVAHVRKRVARVREGAARSSVRARRGAFECGARGAFEVRGGARRVRVRGMWSHILGRDAGSPFRDVCVVTPARVVL